MADYEVFCANAGVPTAGAVLAWESLEQRDNGGAEGSEPAFTDIGGGWYTFSYVVTETMLGVIDLDSDTAIGLSNSDRYVPCKFTVEDNSMNTIRLKTNGLNFTGTDVKATLDGEEVVTDSASRIASKADVSNLDTTVSSRSTFDPTSDEVDIGEVKGVAVAGVNDFKADVSNLDATVSSRSTFDASSDEVDVGKVKGVAVAGVNDFKADVSNLDTTISSRSTFDPASDEVDVGEVKGVAVAGVNDFKADVSNLDTTVSSRSTFDPTSDEVDVGKVKGVAVAGVNDFKADVSNLDATVSSRSTFDPTSDEVDIGKVKGVAVAGVDDFKANVASLATTANLAIVDTNVDAIKAITDTLASIDGLSVNDVLKIMLAMSEGRFTYNTLANAYTYYEQDNVAPLFTLTINRTTGERTRS